MSRQRSEFRNRAEYGAYRTVRALAGSLGPRSLASLGAGVGQLFLATGARRREILEFNLALAYPEKSQEERQVLGREVARHFGRVALDTLRLQRADPEVLMAGVDVSGEEHAEAAFGLGRGVLFLTAHIGMWEVAGLVAGRLLPGKVLAVNRPLDNPLLEEDVIRFRRRFGNEPLGKKNILRGILQHLQHQGSVGFLIDQRVDPSVGVEVPFFGEPAWTHPIIARIVRKTMTPVVPAFALWEGPGKYSVTCLEPVIPDTLSAAELEDVAMTARFSQITEQVIRRRPEQWLWFHDRWRNLRLESQKSRVEN